jgi:hypothetical protein
LLEEDLLDPPLDDEDDEDNEEDDDEDDLLDSDDELDDESFFESLDELDDLEDLVVVFILDGSIPISFIFSCIHFCMSFCILSTSTVAPVCVVVRCEAPSPLRVVTVTVFEPSEVVVVVVEEELAAGVGWARAIEAEPSVTRASAVRRSVRICVSRTSAYTKPRSEDATC